MLSRAGVLAGRIGGVPPPHDMFVWASIAVLILAAAIVVVARERIARLQSLLAGGAVMPGCAIAEAVAILLLAVMILLGHFAGMF